MAENIQVQRPEFVREVETGAFGVVEKSLSRWQRISNRSGLRKMALLLLLAGFWEIYATVLGNALLFPKFSDTFIAFYDGVLKEDHILLLRGWYSIRILVQGYAAGLVLAGILTTLAITTRVGNDLLETLTAMFNPLPAIALLPLALIWFGLGSASIVFVLIHSVLWPVALNMHSGFQSVSQTMRMVGRNYGLSGVRFVAKILMPAAFPNILAGMKIGWAFAWRTLIAAELVFGVSSRSGGLGWFIYENKNQLEIANVFAGLFSVIVIGLIVENFIFRNIEKRTVQVWGMQSAN